MPNLEERIVAWRKTIQTASRLAPETIEELESHLRETAEQFLRSGLSESGAFQAAIAQLGMAPALASEFQKLRPAWLPAKIATGIGVAAAIVLAASIALKPSHSNWLLAGHVFTLTLGYLAGWLLGGLGICFVCQRQWSKFSVSRLSCFRQVNARFAVAAGCLVIMGIGLGSAWSRAEWNQFWNWNPRETAALCVLGWLVLFLVMQKSRRSTAQGLALLSIAGNLVISLAWFGPGLLPGLHGYGASNLFLLLSFALPNIAFFLLGLAPAGLLRPRQAR